MTGTGSYPWSPALANLAVTAAVVLVLFALTLAVAVWVRGGRHDGIDTVWGGGFAVIALTTLIHAVGHGDLWRQLLITGLTCVWGLRLAWHITRRNLRTGEDPRYVEIIEKAPGNPVAHLVRRVYLPQALIMWVVSLPVQLGQFGFADGLVSITVTALGVLGWAVGFAFESVGDAQLAAFKADPANKGRVMDRGLWRYTRHPNYFGDAAVWWGLTLLAPAPSGRADRAGQRGGDDLAAGQGHRGQAAGVHDRRATSRLRRLRAADQRLLPAPTQGTRTRGRTHMNPGDQIEDFELPDETGTPRRLSDLLRDGPVVLFFYPIASSGGCTQEACHFRDLAAEFAAVGAQPVGISGDDVDRQRAFAGAHSLGYPLLSDRGNAVAKRLGAYRWFLPGGLHTRRMTFVIGRDRRLIEVIASERQFDVHADQALAALDRHPTPA